MDETLLSQTPLEFFYLFGNCIATLAEIKSEKNPQMIMIIRHPGGRTAWKLENRLKTKAGLFFDIKILQLILLKI